MSILGSINTKAFSDNIVAAKKAATEQVEAKKAAEAKKAKTIKWVVGGILLLVVGVVTVKMLKRK